MEYSLKLTSSDRCGGDVTTGIRTNQTTVEIHMSDMGRPSLEEVAYQLTCLNGLLFTAAMASSASNPDLLLRWQIAWNETEFEVASIRYNSPLWVDIVSGAANALGIASSLVSIWWTTRESRKRYRQDVDLRSGPERTPKPRPRHIETEVLGLLGLTDEQRQPILDALANDPESLDERRPNLTVDEIGIAIISKSVYQTAYILPRIESAEVKTPRE